MIDEKSSRDNVGFNFYGPQYSRFDSLVAAQIRREVYGGDIGQQGWRTSAEQVEIADLVPRGSEVRVLDIGCGAGGPSLALVERIGCRLNGLDVEPIGITHATAQAAARGLSDRATFAVADCNERLPFKSGSFDAVLCIDAISHLRDRIKTLSELSRLLKSGGRVIYTDNFVLTGAVAKDELDRRAAIGFHLIVPPGFNEQSIKTAGLTLIRREDRTSAVAEIAQRWHAARLGRASILQREEGADWFDRRQNFLATTAELAASRRLSGFLYIADKVA
jgi:SAM-dependent methyltransferase